MIKHIATILLALTCAFGAAQAKKMSDLKIYINPGHGGYTSNDRPIRIYPFEQNDTLGFWESKSNLYKGLHMYHILDSLGAKPYLSRTKNTEDDDRSLSGIAAEANNLGVDLFFSIHSNAGEDVNTPLMLYRENTIGTPRYPGNVTLSKILWNNLHSSKLAEWTRSNEYVVGDLTFYQNMWQGGLGVLRTLYVVGLLSEGQMHEHKPEAHRMMNDDYLWLEAWHFVKSIMEYEDTDDRFVTGNVAGIVYDNHNLREYVQPANFSKFGRDCFAPVNGATVELLDASDNVVQKRTTDNMYNGVFVFRNVSPGNYKLRAVRSDYYQEVTPVTVTANEVTYQDMPMSLRREAPLKILSYAPVAAGDELVSCASTIDFTFNYDVDTESFENAFTITPAVEGYWVYSDSYHKASYVPRVSLDQSTTYTVKVDASARHSDNRYSHPQMDEPLQFDFTTRSRSRLEVIDRFPSDNGSIHYQNPSVEFRFDRTINSTSASKMITITDSKGTNVSLNSRQCKYNQLSNNYGSALYVLSGSLTPGEKYHVVLSGELRDRESLPIGDDVEFDFTAIDASADAPAQSTVAIDFESDVTFEYDKENTTGIGNVLPGFIRSTEKKLFGSYSGRFSYRFTDDHDGQIVWNYTGAPIQYNTDDVLGMYINGDFNSHELWVGLTSGTNKKYTYVCDLDFLGWQYREVKLSNLEKDFCPFLLSDVKIIQKKSPITQNGAFCIDNISRQDADDAGVNDILADGDTSAKVITSPGLISVSEASADARVTVNTLSGVTVGAAKGNATFRVAPGIYIVTVSSHTVKISVP